MLKLSYATPQSHITLEHRAIVGIAYVRSPKWRRFIKTNPLSETKWYNEIVDWLIKTYPNEFKLT